MAIDAKTVEHIAKLCRLGLSESEKQKVSRELSAILEYVAKLQELETQRVEATMQVGGLENVWRDDAESRAPAHHPGPLKEAFPKKKDGFLEVAAVFKE
ncbi:Asp-tRNA(Asn)/Glu-tRNA(Gln) amidotransferase subunit GatC [Candidatus Parcubacteria bacterium]|nr:Asp-tRNA(Asn)/Glu-tRNA(Gln) amidotransferase subunit GatC [Candidatus Parcubacteria bacterium]